MQTQGRKLNDRLTLDTLRAYGLALACELPVILLRCVLAVLIVPTLVSLCGHWVTLGRGWLEIALLPTLWSTMALLGPIGTGWWWQQCTGGREPSQRELNAYRDAIELLRSHSPEPLLTPKSWFVLDSPELDAAVLGDTVMLSRGLLESEHLAPVLAHELGHLASTDGRLATALGRMVLLAARTPIGKGSEQDQPARKARVITLLLGGGLGLSLTGPLWAAYWRRREYQADAYAAALGQGEDLAEFLESHALFHDQPVPHLWLSGHTYPPVELRIDRLCGQAAERAGA